MLRRQHLTCKLMSKSRKESSSPFTESPEPAFGDVAPTLVLLLLLLLFMRVAPVLPTAFRSQR